MTRSLQQTAKRGLYASGWYDQRISQLMFPGVLVLCYHGLRSSSWQIGERAFPDLHVDQATFEGHCSVLSRTCHPIDLATWRRAREGGEALPSRPVLVTFDDGYRSLFDVARPILKRHGIRAAIFVSTEAVETQQSFWFDQVARGTPSSAISVDDPLAPMTIAQVKTMSEEGFEIGAHTVSHPVLAARTAAEQRYELAQCRDTLEKWTGRRPLALAYPFGKPNTDYSAETVSIARDLGFECAFTTQPDFVRPAQSPLERSRFLMLAAVSPSEIAHRIAHSWHH
jgi:peptidoglycan/xylan/chitin deacetylase (PgdA/CDA1 family)